LDEVANGGLTERRVFLWFSDAVLMKLVVFLLTLLLFSPCAYAADYASDYIPRTENPFNYEEGYRYNIQGWIYAHIEGDAYERGYQHGQLLYAEIVDMIYRWSNVIHNSPFFLKNIPVNQTSERYEKISHTWWNYCKRKAVDFFGDAFPNEYIKEMQGIADAVASRGGTIYGETASYEDILTINEMYELMTILVNPRKGIHPLKTLFYDLLGVTPELKGREGEFLSSMVTAPMAHHCSGFIATGDATTHGQIVATDSVWCGGWWYPHYIAQRWNVILDIEPTDGSRVIMATSPGYMWSDENYYQNGDGIILVDTTCPQSLWKKNGLTLAVRSRKAAQYSRSIDEVLHHLREDNNGVWTAAWLIGDTKTGEIARLDLGLYASGLWRTTNGFYWSANNIMHEDVRKEQIFFEGLKGRVYQLAHFLFNTSGYEYYTRKYTPAPRDLKFEELGNEYYGRIDVNIVKEIMSTPPISDISTDCKVTDSDLLTNFSLWAFWGNPYGDIWNNSIDKQNLRGVKDVPPAGWVLIPALPTDVTPSFMSPSLQDIGAHAECLWDVDIGGKNHEYGSGTLRDGVLYITTNMGKMYAIDTARGTVLWDMHLEDNPVAPLAYDDMVLSGSETLYAFTADGSEKWRKDIRASSPPVPFKNSLLVGTVDGTLYALTAEGEEIWRTEFDGPVFPSYDTTHIYATSGSSCYCIDEDTTEILWSFQTNGPILSPPLLIEKTVYFGGTDTSMYALNAKDGTLRWTYRAGWGIKSTPVFADGCLFFGSLDNTFYALDAQDGVLRWSFTCQSAIQGSPAVYGEYVFFGCDDGRVYAINKSDGRVAWSFSPSFSLNGDVYNYLTTPIPSNPVVGDDKLYIAAGGTIFALDTQTEEKEDMNENTSGIPSSTIALVIVPVILLLLLTFLYYRKG
jgi:outer membrane protein assembly factor BamB